MIPFMKGVFSMRRHREKGGKKPLLLIGIGFVALLLAAGVLVNKTVGGGIHESDPLLDSSLIQ